MFIKTKTLINIDILSLVHVAIHDQQSVSRSLYTAFSGTEGRAVQGIFDDGFVVEYFNDRTTIRPTNLLSFSSGYKYFVDRHTTVCVVW